MTRWSPRSSWACLRPKGGALEVRHSGTTARYRGSRKGLSFVAFYSDCRHEPGFKPVRSGYRVVLTYDLLLRSEPATSPSDLDPELVSSLAGCLDEHFAPPGGEDRLVYLLDHEYTRRGLDWSRLKGADPRRAALLEAAADRAGCEVVLGLADVHETWTAYEAEEYGRSGYGRWDDWQDDVDSFDDETGDYDLHELIESEVKLDWIDSRGTRLSMPLSIGNGEVCASTPSGDLEPYLSEYEGYMGNWGNTLDRWYRRGAVVLWPRSRDFAVRAEAAPAFALDELAARARRGDVIGAREAAAELAPFWDRVATQVEAKGFFTNTLRTARLLENPAPAAMLLRPFRLELVATTHAKPLSALIDSYGERWAGELVAAWSAKWRFHHSKDLERWMLSVPQLCVAFSEIGAAGTPAARLLLRESWKWLSQRIKQSLELSSPSHRQQALCELGRPVAAILNGAELVGVADVRDEAVGVLCGDGDVIGCALAVLRATTAPRLHSVGLDGVAMHCAASLEARLALPPRASDDWSIELPVGCGCELCEGLRAFLRDATRTTFAWPLAKDRPAHVHHRIDAAELPVEHHTRRVGRPYTLVLTKTDALFSREAQRRRRDERDLLWLTRNRGDRGDRAKRRPG
jgi:hypothetical protein